MERRVVGEHVRPEPRRHVVRELGRVPRRDALAVLQLGEPPRRVAEAVARAVEVRARALEGLELRGVLAESRDERRKVLQEPVRADVVDLRRRAVQAAEVFLRRGDVEAPAGARVDRRVARVAFVEVRRGDGVGRPIPGRELPAPVQVLLEAVLALAAIIDGAVDARRRVPQRDHEARRRRQVPVAVAVEPVRGRRGVGVPGGEVGGLDVRHGDAVVVVRVGAVQLLSLIHI